MLRIAIPNKGSLHTPTVELLAEAGYRLNREPRSLFAHDPDNNVQAIYWRATDIARNVGSGVLDVGVTGQDLLAGAGTDERTREVLSLGFGNSEFYFAVAGESSIGAVDELDGARIATSHPRLAEQAARQHGISIEPVVLDGAVESAVELGLAEGIADVVETGSSLRAAGLVTIGEPILHSQAVLVRGTAALTEEQEHTLQVLVQRLQGVLDARRYAVMDYNCPSEALETVAAITPGKESPTVSDLAEPGWKAVRVMVPRVELQATMDKVAAAGGTQILVTRLEACRL